MTRLPAFSVLSSNYPAKSRISTKALLDSIGGADLPGTHVRTRHVDLFSVVDQANDETAVRAGLWWRVLLADRSRPDDCPPVGDAAMKSILPFACLMTAGGGVVLVEGGGTFPSTTCFATERTLIGGKPRCRLTIARTRKSRRAAHRIFARRDTSPGPGRKCGGGRRSALLGAGGASTVRPSWRRLPLVRISKHCAASAGTSGMS